MLGYIDGIDFGELDAMKYYTPPATWSDEKKKDNVRAKVFSGEWLGAEKKDGYFAKFVKDDEGNALLYSRSRNTKGVYVNKVEWVPHLAPFFDALPNGTCLLGELYFPKAPGSKNVTTIMQCLKDKAVARQETGEKLHFYIFDVLAIKGSAGLEAPAGMRFKVIDHLKKQFGDVCEYVEYAEYLRGQELWVMLQTVLEYGGEGIVITNEYAKYEPGARPSKTTLKVKKELRESIDCFFTGKTMPPTKEYTGKELETWKYWQDVVTGEKIEGELAFDYSRGRAIIPVTKSYFYGFAGSLEIGVYGKNGEIVPIGYLSGLAEKVRANPQEYAMKPLAVTAMEMDTSGAVPTLRHGKLLSFRSDLSLSDCTLEKLISIS